MKGKYLITTDDWFFAPNGKRYRAVYGEVKILGDEETLNIKTNRASSNWYAIVGSESKCVIIAGCQIHYAVKTDGVPYSGNVHDNLYTAETGLVEFERPREIYIAE